jgi:hypothetical protein
MQQPLLLAVSYAGSRIAKGSTATVTDLDEYPSLTITHDEIKLTTTDRYIGGDES